MAAQWVEQALASLVGGPTFASLRTEVKKGDMVAHTFNLSTWEVERNGWGEREKEGKGGGRAGGKEGRGRIVFFFLRLSFLNKLMRLCLECLLHTRFLTGPPAATSAEGNIFQLQWITKLLTFKITLPP